DRGRRVSALRRPGPCLGEIDCPGRHELSDLAVKPRLSCAAQCDAPFNLRVRRSLDGPEEIGDAPLLVEGWEIELEILQVTPVRARRQRPCRRTESMLE